MKPLDRNISVLEHIVTYCEQIEQTVERFGNSAETFRADPIYRNAAALCILQIGAGGKQLVHRRIVNINRIDVYICRPGCVVDHR